MWSERSVGIEGQGESVSTLKFLWKDSIYMFWVCTSGVELHSLNASVTGRGSLIYQVKNPLWEPLIANLYIWVLNPCLKTTKKQQKQQNSLKTNVLSTLNDPWYDSSHEDLSDYYLC